MNPCRSLKQFAVPYMYKVYIFSPMCLSQKNNFAIPYMYLKVYIFYLVCLSLATEEYVPAGCSCGWSVGCDWPALQIQFECVIRHEPDAKYYPQISYKPVYFLPTVQLTSLLVTEGRGSGCCHSNHLHL